MRSPWLSREYKKINDVKVMKDKTGYLLINKKNNKKLFLTNVEYEKYENNTLNEIEWEKLFFNGLALDKNCSNFEVSESFDITSKEFIKSSKVESFPLKTKNGTFEILINPELGSWIALTKEEYSKYQKDKLSKYEWFSLFIRGLLKIKNIQN